MKKTLLTIASIGLSVCAIAQTNGKTVKSGQTANNNIAIVNASSIINAVSTSTCVQITTQTTTSVVINVVATSTSCASGFVNGTNCYGDLEKSNFFPATTFASVSSPTITGVSFGFYKSSTRGITGSAATVTCSIYNGSMASGPAGSSITSATASISQILAAHTSTTSSFFLFPFTFATPVIAPASGFFAALTIPTTAGDTIVIYNENGATTNFGWERQTDNIWYDMGSASGWGTTYKASLSIYPNVCGTAVATGISKNLGLSSNVTILPNPTAGLINIAVILQDKENLNISVANALGQVLVNNKYDGISNDLLSLDLSGFNNGVYFVTVSNGKDKMVQRIVLSK